MIMIMVKTTNENKTLDPASTLSPTLMGAMAVTWNFLVRVLDTRDTETNLENIWNSIQWNY